jgi:NTP pyrophosphatase (non-canonical NTP hydrolase)
MNLNLNELKDRAYVNAKEHGFHDNDFSDEHYLMLIITEIGEAVDADRKNRRIDIANFKESIKAGYPYPWRLYFECFIKDTVEDEFADIAIRLLDLAGMKDITIDIENVQIRHGEEYFSGQLFTQTAYDLSTELIKDSCIEELIYEDRINDALAFLFEWAEYLKIDLSYQISAKMKYNELRDYMHNNKY